MRTRNHFCIGDGCEGFKTVLCGHYPAGRVAVLCFDLTEGQSVAATLLKTHKVSLLSAFDKEKKKEDVRFVVGVGKPEIIPAVKSFAEGVPFAFFAKEVDYRYLNAFDGKGELAEFAYLDKKELTENAYLSCYSTLFSLWCEGQLRLLEESCFPYKSRALAGIIISAESILRGECDKDDFFTECLRLISVMTCAFLSYKTLYVERAAVLGDDPQARFLSSYLLLNLVKNFTKVPYSAILNPSEEKKNRFIYDSSVLPDEEKMKSFARRMKAMSALPTTSVDEFLSLLAPVCSPDLPLFSVFIENGFLKGWAHEKLTRDRGVFI